MRARGPGSTSHGGGTPGYDRLRVLTERIMAKLLLGFILLVPSFLSAQEVRDSAAPRPIVLSRPAFASWEGSAPEISAAAVRMPVVSGRRLRHALIGGVIGAAAGAVVCTAISNLADDAAVDRFTTCTAKGYLLTGGIGFGAGFLVGWLGSS